jgi:DGQHR domain-containing protein
MQYFFAENCDWVDPGYDFSSDQLSPNRQPQIDDVYPHECFEHPPYDGLLISRSIVGGDGFAGKYTQGQRYRLRREGARRFLRFPSVDYQGDPKTYPIMGDCGSFSYINRNLPPVTTKEMVDFYVDCDFTHAVSVDHIISVKDVTWDDLRRLPNSVESRAELTLHNAGEFLQHCQRHKVGFTPIGAVQSWSPKSAALYAKRLVGIGYDYIGLGGLVGHPWTLIYNTICEVRSQIPSYVRIHLFGFTLIQQLDQFVGLDITSFDSTAPLLKAFKDDRDNYFGVGKERYIAIRIPPQTESKISRKIKSGQIDQDEVSELEQQALDSVHSYACGEADLEDTLDRVAAYEAVAFPGRDMREAYRRTLHEKPWESCSCPICRAIGVEVMIYRGINRNKRRGFHNLFQFYNYFHQVREGMTELVLPCIKTEQSPQRYIYSFVVNGKQISQFARISRINRGGTGQLTGYQRPEVQDHINEIRMYLERDDAILPNSIVVAFQDELRFEPISAVGKDSQVGTLRIDLSNGEKPGWIVDGQQRVAALRTLKKEGMPVSVIAFRSGGVEEEREQFMLVNSTKPLPKSLVYELLPSIDGYIPPRMRKRRAAYQILEHLNWESDSPFCLRIKTTTSQHIETANIKDMSVLKMLENSMRDGVLFRFQRNPDQALQLLKNYWSAVKEVFAIAWDFPPKKSRLTHGVGIVSMGYMMDTIGYKILPKRGVPTVQAFRRELKKISDDTPWTEGIWIFSDELRLPWDEIQNTSRHIELVANFLVRKYRERIIDRVGAD